MYCQKQLYTYIIIPISPLYVYSTHRPSHLPIERSGEASGL